MKKYFVVATAFLLITVFTVAQGTDNAPDQAPDQSQPTIPDNPGTAPGKGVSGVVPDGFPGGQTAQNVLNTIDEVGSGLDLGNALSDLLGGQPENETEEE